MKAKDVYKRMHTAYPDVVTIEQMCEMLGGISKKTGDHLLKNGTIKSLIVGRRYRIPKINVLEYLILAESD
jgi:excisionase family DNA binding protein